MIIFKDISIMFLFWLLVICACYLRLYRQSKNAGDNGERNLRPKSNNIINKNRIYIEMFALSLPYIRNIQSLDVQERCEDRSCYFEAELIHNLSYALLDKQFTSYDIWFLNCQAKYYYTYCNEHISLNYNKQIEYIKELFRLVPDELKTKLEWKGP